MPGKTVVAFVLFASIASPALADIPLPPDRKYADPRVRFEGVDKLPDHVFFLRFRSSPGNPFAGPPVTIEVKNAEVFNLKASRRIADMHLLAMPRKDFNKRKEADPSMDWLTEKTEGVLRANVEAPSTVISAKEKEAPVTSYRVSLKDGKLVVEPADAKKERSDAAPAGNTPTAVAGLFGSMSLAGLGLWYRRRQSGRS